MPFDVQRLRDSSMAHHDNAEVFRAAVLLWCAAWHNVPAGSLKDDNKELARLAGFARDVTSWKAIRDDALHGFVLCSDGRLYHSVVCEISLQSWTKRQRFIARSQKGNAGRHGSVSDGKTATSSLKETNKAPKGREGKGSEVKIEESPSDPPLAAKVHDFGQDDLLACMFGDPGQDEEAAGGPDPADRGTGPMLTAIPKAKVPKRAERRCPVTWSPNPKHEAIAFSDLHMTGQQYDLQLAMFRDYQFKNAMTDWDAAFRNWLRKPFTSTPRGTNGNGQPTYYDRKNDAYARELGGVFEAMDAAVQQSSGRHRG